MEIYTQPLAGSKKRSFESIDLMKFICAILVVCIHMSPFGKPGDPVVQWIDRILRHNIARISVPFFFMCTGFLIFRKFDPASFSMRSTLGYVRKSYRLYLIWVLIYSGFIIANILQNERGALYGVSLFVRNLIFTGAYSHLWYLNASAFALLLVSFLLHRRVKPEKILGIAFVFYLMGLMLQPYYGALDPLRSHPLVGKLLRAFDLIIVTPRNGLFEGFFFVGMGMIFAYKPIRMPMKAAVAGFIASMLLMLLETTTLSTLNWMRGYDIYLFLAPAAFFLFYAVSHVTLRKRKIYKYLRLSSALIFFFHIFVGELLTILYANRGIEANTQPSFFFLTLIISMLISHLIIKLSARPKFAWLKVLYS